MTGTVITEHTALLRFSRPAMATTFEIAFPWGTKVAERAAADAFDLIDRLEAQLTVFRDTSEVCRLNRLGHQAPVPVESELFQLLLHCQKLSRQTGGAFDISSGPLTKAWGFFARQGRVPSKAELTTAIACVGADKVTLDEMRSSAHFARPGVEINLGSIGKGYALDRVGRMLRTLHGIPGAILQSGTSSVLAIGDNIWPIGVKHPDGTRRLGTIQLRDRAMATSGATHQHFNHNGRKLGHLLDPRTGRPVEGMALAFALAPTAAEADALATAFYVMGLEGTQAYCAEHQEIAALLMTDQPGAKPITFNMTDEWTLAGPTETYSATWNDE